jgi:hypothetical protein
VSGWQQNIHRIERKNWKLEKIENEKTGFNEWSQNQ